MQANDDHKLVTARGKVNADVFAIDMQESLQTKYLVECKLWKNNIPQEKIHAFRTVMNDIGADTGIMISKKGYQSGVKDAASFTNVRVLTWREFESMFRMRWLRHYFCPEVSSTNKSLYKLTKNLLDTSVINEIDRLNAPNQTRYYETSAKWYPLALSMLPVAQLTHHSYMFSFEDLETVALPIRANTNEALPADILDASSFRELLEAFKMHAQSALSEFDDIFGKRIRYEDA